MYSAADSVNNKINSKNNNNQKLKFIWYSIKLKKKLAQKHLTHSCGTLTT